jgi:hypothetical protein
MRYMSPGAVGLTFASMLSPLLRAKVASLSVPADRNWLMFSLLDNRARRVLARRDCGSESHSRT